MEGGPSSPRAPELDAYIYDYLISRNMVATAKAFVEETQGTPSAPDLQRLDVSNKGFLSDWFSILLDRFSHPSPGSSEYPEGYASEETPLATGDHFSLEEVQMQQRAGALANSNCSNNAVLSHIMPEDPVADSAVHQRLRGRTPVDITASGLTQQQYQQPTDDSGADNMLDSTRDVSTVKTLGTGTGITIAEVFKVRASRKRMFCCSLSSDGEWLGGAGEENKVLLWSLKNNLEKYSWEAHSSFITDMSFRPNRTMLATASSDKTVRLWDISQGSDPLVHTFVGHSSLVRSVDFHPKADAPLLCSCDDAGKVLFWKIDKRKPRHTSEATGRGKLRFDPTGNLLASVIGSTVNLTDVMTDKRTSCLQGNVDNKTVHSVCWSEYHRGVAAVSDDCVRIWRSEGGGHVRELSGTNQSYFRSCVFHPKHANTLIIGGYQRIILWNFAENKVVSVQPHDGYVSDLAGRRATGMMASASHDGCVKVWS